MSRDEITRRIGAGAIIANRANFLEARSLPLQGIYFDHFMCFFDNNKLWAIKASGKSLATVANGEELRKPFEELEAGLEDKYGKTLYVTGSRKANIAWADTRPGLVFTGAYWAENEELRRSAHIQRIALEVKLLDGEHGYLELSYDFTTLVEGPL